MTPSGQLYHVIVNGQLYPSDLETLKAWIAEGRVTPHTLIGKGSMKPIPAKDVPALRDLFPKDAFPPGSGPLPSSLPSFQPPAPPPASFGGYPQPAYGQPQAPPNPYSNPSPYSGQGPAMPGYPPAAPTPYQQPHPISNPYAAQGPSIHDAPSNPYGALMMNPYAAAPQTPYAAAPYHVAPTFHGEFPTEAHKQDSRYIEAMKHIKSAWVMGIISGCLTLLIVMIASASGTAIAGLDSWAILDVFLIFGLTFGVYRKSRTCAVILLVYFLASKIFQIISLGALALRGIFITIVVIVCYIQGVRGTFAYHNLKDEAERGWTG